MTDHKFTEDEIIKGLKCLSGEEIFCKDCAFAHLEDHGFACKKNVANAALALIKRQKAIIKSEKKNIKFETGDYAKIANNKSGHAFEIGTIVKLEKHAEDYKAFANDDFWWVTDDDLVEIDNDTLVKEMTEDQK